MKELSGVLKKLQVYVERIEGNSSTLAKTEVLEEALQDEDVATLIWWVYNPYKKFNITSKNCEKLKTKLKPMHIAVNSFELFVSHLEKFSTGFLSGHNAIECVLGWVEQNQNYKDLVYRIVDKDLKFRANISLINRAKGSRWIPEFKVALAEKYDEKKDTIDEDWYVSHKLDGVRCLCIYKDNEVKFWSRQGMEFFTLANVEKDIRVLAKDFARFGKTDFVLDGEICIVDSNGKENFQGIMKEIRKKNHTIKTPLFKVFDFLTWEEFDSGTSKMVLSDRLQSLLAQIQDLDTPCVDVLEQNVCTTENLAKLQKRAEEEDWEGLIVRKNATYKGKRSRDMLKLKKFFDAEYEVQDVELGEMRIVEDGKEKPIKCLTAVYIKHEGYDVKVGSGFDIEQRQKYYENPQDIIGKTITVQYFEVTHNQEGGISLRFPTVKHIYNNGRKV